MVGNLIIDQCKVLKNSISNSIVEFLNYTFFLIFLDLYLFFLVFLEQLSDS